MLVRPPSHAALRSAVTPHVSLTRRPHVNRAPTAALPEAWHATQVTITLRHAVQLADTTSLVHSTAVPMRRTPSLFGQAWVLPDRRHPAHAPPGTPALVGLTHPPPPPTSTPLSSLSPLKFRQPCWVVKLPHLDSHPQASGPTAPIGVSRCPAI